MDTAIFRVSEFTVNSFIYCCLIFYTIKRICSIKSLSIRDGVTRFVQILTFDTASRNAFKIKRLRSNNSSGVFNDT